MSEGELEKRLKKALPWLFEPIEDDDSFTLTVNEAGEIRYKVTKIIQRKVNAIPLMLVEARKEFLALAPEITDHIKMKIYEKLVAEGHATGYVKLLVALKKWFFAV